MIARVTLEIALRKEFDYSIPPALSEQVEVGTRASELVDFAPGSKFVAQLSVATGISGAFGLA